MTRPRRKQPSESRSEKGSSVTFIAMLPPIKQAITLDGNGDGGEMRLAVDRENVGALLLVQQQFAEKIFRVTITLEDDV